MREQAEKWANFVLANLLWSLCAIPIITLPAATAGLFAVASSQVRGKPLSLFEEFFGTMRRLWLKASAIVVLDLLVAGLLVTNLLIFQLMGTLDVMGFLARSVSLFVGLALLLTNLYVWSLMVISDMPVGQLIETSYKLVFAHPLQSCAVLVAATLPLVISLLLPRGVFLLVTASACAFIISRGTWPIIQHHVPDSALPYL
jgi:uncharacterized membrane protein YesL